MRIVSLLASGTEIVHALGLGDRLVGRSHECDFPPAVKALPAVTAPKIPTEGSSREIDDRIRDIVSRGLSVYLVDAEKLRALQPDVVVTQTQCQVCAVSESDVEAALAEWTGARPTIVSLSPDSLGDIWNDFRRVADALGVPA